MPFIPFSCGQNILKRSATDRKTIVAAGRRCRGGSKSNNREMDGRHSSKVECARLGVSGPKGETVPPASWKGLASTYASEHDCHSFGGRDGDFQQQPRRAPGVVSVSSIGRRNGTDRKRRKDRVVDLGQASASTAAAAAAASVIAAEESCYRCMGGAPPSRSSSDGSCRRPSVEDVFRETNPGGCLSRIPLPTTTGFFLRSQRQDGRMGPEEENTVGVIEAPIGSEGFSVRGLPLTGSPALVKVDGGVRRRGTAEGKGTKGIVQHRRRHDAHCRGPGETKSHSVEKESIRGESCQSCPKRYAFCTYCYCGLAHMRITSILYYSSAVITRISRGDVVHPIDSYLTSKHALSNSVEPSSYARLRCVMGIGSPYSTPRTSSLQERRTCSVTRRRMREHK